MPASDLSHEEIIRIYGPWLPRTPTDVGTLLDGYSGRWWIAGGWAIEAFTGVHRDHADIDPSIPRSELPLLRHHLAGRIDLWAADQETLRVLLPQDAHDDQLPDSCENVWARPSGADPWQYDIILMRLEADTWVFKRDRRITRPVDQIVWSRDGINYLRPEIQLLHKARGMRPKDQQDFDTVLPLLADDDRNWLRAAIKLAHPDHPWLSAI